MALKCIDILLPLFEKYTLLGTPTDEVLDEVKLGGQYQEGRKRQNYFGVGLR